MCEGENSHSDLSLCDRLCFSAAGGEIFNQCVSDEAFSEEDVKRLMRQILEGVSFLHQNNVVHLDLKVSTPVSFISVVVAEDGGQANVLRELLALGHGAFLMLTSCVC